ncbi:MAG TPA: transporter [Verrucomicrobiae bacterium]|jgi:Na+/proline symporter|nr:transporter [Verrucomicrobiae bacterium]
MLSRYDYAVIAFYFLFMLVIGWVCRRFISNTSDYFRGGGKVLWWMVGSSAFMLSFSAWTFTGAASKAYQDGFIIVTIYVGNAIGFLFNYLVFAARFRQMRVITAMQAVRKRFGPANEQFFTWLQIPLGILYAGIWLMGLSVFISAVFNQSLAATIAVTGVVVLIIAVLGGSWAVVAGDFIQMLILMPVTIIAAVFAIAQVGGVGAFFQKLPRHHLMITEGARSEILYLWIIAILIKQFIVTNTLLESSRYLSVKDTRNARMAALLGTALFLIGPLVWFIPPMVAAITHPDLHAMFPRLPNPSEGSYIAACFDFMPAGMIGLLISGIFAATMSAMDGGLNRNAGFFVKNFYQIVLRPDAKETELLFAAKITTAVFGVLVIFAASAFSNLQGTNLFSLMQNFGGWVAIPYSMPLVWGILIKRAPSWAGWSTVLIGFSTSLAGQYFFNADWVQHTFHWSALTKRETSDWSYLIGALLNVLVCSIWFLGSCAFAKSRPVEEQKRVEEFFITMKTPVHFEQEGGVASDRQQCRTLGMLCLIYGSFLALMLAIPNSLAGRLGIAFCVACMLVPGGILYFNSAKQTALNAAEASK